jgi:RNA polymerase-associated protein CTR9
MKANYNLALARRAPKTVLASPRRSFAFPDPLRVCLEPNKHSFPKPGGGPLLHSVNPDHPESKIQEPSAPPLTKDEYWNAAGVCLGRAESIQANDKTVMDLKGEQGLLELSRREEANRADPTAALLLARGRLDEASKVFDSILSSEPTNLFALMGRVSNLLQPRVLSPADSSPPPGPHPLRPPFIPSRPQSLPNRPLPRAQLPPRPSYRNRTLFLDAWRTGTGPQSLGAIHRRRAFLSLTSATASTNGPVQQHPNSTSNSATVLLGLAHLNASKDPNLSGGEDARTTEYEKGLKHIQTAFKMDNTSAAAAGPLATYFLLSGKPGVCFFALGTEGRGS